MLFKIIVEKMSEGYIGTSNSRITLIPFEQRYCLFICLRGKRKIFPPFLQLNDGIRNSICNCDIVCKIPDNRGVECSPRKHNQICQQHNVPAIDSQVSGKRYIFLKCVDIQIYSMLEIISR